MTSPPIEVFIELPSLDKHRPAVASLPVLRYTGVESFGGLDRVVLVVCLDATQRPLLLELPHGVLLVPRNRVLRRRRNAVCQRCGGIAGTRSDTQRRIRSE